MLGFDRVITLRSPEVAAKEQVLSLMIRCHADSKRLRDGFTEQQGFVLISSWSFLPLASPTTHREATRDQIIAHASTDSTAALGLTSLAKLPGSASGPQLPRYCM